MSKISFEGIGEMVATFACAEDVAAGQVVKITADGTVGTCAAVQLGGLVKVATTGGSITAGWCKLSADGSGGMKQDGSAGTEYLVVRVETDAAVICL